MNQLPLRVSLQRWQQAQAWEGAVWQQENPVRSIPWRTRLRQKIRSVMGLASPDTDQVKPGDDWNQWWAEKFSHYATLPEKFENVIEVGSGPYTNIRLILEGREATRVICSDPLIRQYITFRGQWLADQWRKGQLQIDDHPLEDCPFSSDCFDLVVMINVLDHCRDSLVCLEQVKRITKRGGFLIVGQDLSNVDDVQCTGDDIGHPIRIDHETLDQALLSEFIPVQHTILSRAEGRNPPAHYGTYLFIGQKTVAT